MLWVRNVGSELNANSAPAAQATRLVSINVTWTFIGYTQTSDMSDLSYIES